MAGKGEETVRLLGGSRFVVHPTAKVKQRPPAARVPAPRDQFVEDLREGGTDSRQTHSHMVHLMDQPPAFRAGLVKNLI
jgi:hypothetical protein